MPKSLTALCAIPAFAIAIFSAVSAAAGDIVISDAYARSSGKSAKSGAIFLTIENTGDTDDRLVGVTTERARKAELHTHIESDDGVMMMREVEDGFAVQSGGQHRLARGGDHVMLMGLNGPMSDGDEFDIVLRFENAGELSVTVPIDLKRKPKSHGMSDLNHSDHSGNADSDN